MNPKKIIIRWLASPEKLKPNPLPKTQNPKPRAVPDGCDVNLKFSCAQKWLKRQNLLLIMIANVYL